MIVVITPGNHGIESWAGVGGSELLCLCVCFVSFHIHSYLLALFFCLFGLFHSCCSHARVFEKTHVHDFHIFIAILNGSYSLWYLLFVLCRSHIKLNQTTIIIIMYCRYMFTQNKWVFVIIMLMIRSLNDCTICLEILMQFVLASAICININNQMTIRHTKVDQLWIHTFTRINHFNFVLVASRMDKITNQLMESRINWWNHESIDGITNQWIESRINWWNHESIDGITNQLMESRINW